MTLTQYNTTVGHTGIDRLCLAQKCYRTRTKLAEVGKPPPLQVGEDVTRYECVILKKCSKGTGGFRQMPFLYAKNE